MPRTASFTEADGKRAIKLVKMAQESGLPVRGYVVRPKECEILFDDELDVKHDVANDAKPLEWPED